MVVAGLAPHFGLQRPHSRHTQPAVNAAAALTTFTLCHATLPRSQSTFTTPLGRAVHGFFFDAKQRGAGVPVHELFLPK